MRKIRAIISYVNFQINTHKKNFSYTNASLFIISLNRNEFIERGKFYNEKNILLIHTGGTISMKMNETGAVLPNEQNPLIGISQKLAEFANITEIEAFNLPSPHITPKEMLELRDLIMKQANNGQVDGIVITHGTDTLEETAYFLELTTQFSFPIVLTGAMRSSNELGADGVYNLVEAVRVACDENARDKGVIVVMNDEIHHSFNITKTSTSSINTFQSPQYGPIGLVTKKLCIFIMHRFVDVSSKYILFKNELHY